VMDAWKAEVSAAGVELLDYVPDFAFKARMTPEAAARVAALDSVAWVGLFHPAYKLDPVLLRPWRLPTPVWATVPCRTAFSTCLPLG